MAYLDSSFLFFALLVALASIVAQAGQSSNRQDFCVATNDPSGILRVDGYFCKNPENITVEDFTASTVKIPPIIKSKFGVNNTIVRVNTLGGLNTLGISLTRYDFAPYGINSLHIHPRGTELLIVVTGTFYCGFVSSSLSQGVIQNRLFAKVLNPGDVMVFPQGLPQFQYNLVNAPGLIFATLRSEDFGRVGIAESVFGCKPPIDPVVIQKSFQVSRDIVVGLQNSFAGSQPN